MNHRRISPPTTMAQKTIFILLHHPPNNHPIAPLGHPASVYDGLGNQVCLIADLAAHPHAGNTGLTQPGSCGATGAIAQLLGQVCCRHHAAVDIPERLLLFPDCGRMLDLSRFLHGITPLSLSSRPAHALSGSALLTSAGCAIMAEEGR